MRLLRTSFFDKHLSIRLKIKTANYRIEWTAYRFSMKMLIDTFVNAVFLYDDKMVLNYNFHESTETITFGEL